MTDRHGIFRFWDVVDPNHADTRLVPENITVTRDGRPDEVDMSRASRGPLPEWPASGRPTNPPLGDHVYTIGYTIRGVLTPGVDGHPTELYWNIIPRGWRQDIDEATSPCACRLRPPA
ncbi:MAG: DUF2207 domain-containing protein [Acidimicrobiales bacterium]